MCTVTWWRDDGKGYEVFFNRDELKTRAEASGPGVRERHGTRYLAPQDPESGGTWLAANEHGVTVGILNLWQMEPPELEPYFWRSRGKVVTRLADVRSAAEAGEKLDEIMLERVRPFQLLVFDREGERGWEWAGEDLQPFEPEMPVCSSGYRFEEVAAARKEQFRVMAVTERLGPDLLERYHRETAPGEASAYSVRMCRTDAQTWSVSRIRVSEAGVEFVYWAERPELEGEAAMSRERLDCGCA